MVDIAKSARKQGIKNIIVSNGYINPAPLKKLCRYVDAANIDIKGFTEKFYSSYTGTSLKPVLKSIKALHDSGKWVELTNLVIPGLNDDPKYMQKMCLWIRKNLGTDVPVHFSRFYPYYRSKDIPITPVNTLMNARSIAMNAGLRYVYTGNLGVMDNTYCHKCKSLLIKRAGYDIKVIGLSGAKNNRCSGCGAVIPGIFTF
jgi:pyruvate formate lyase activating enzyme